jgi:hypothetical protein
MPRGWLALDDNHEGWSLEHAASLVLTHAYEGISDPEVRADIEWKLREMHK